MNRHMLPHAFHGARIGLLGGSFDPAHAGHVHLSHQAIMRMGLDQLWWLVSPANPLKPAQPQPMAQRMNAAHRMAAGHPKIKICDIEQHLGTRYTADTLAHLGRLYPRTNFVWIMGADNLAQFHRWKDWQQIMAHMPVAVFARPRERMRALTSPAAKTYAQYRRDIRALAPATPPAWGFANMPMRADSSSALRATGQWATGQWGSGRWGSGQWGAA